MSPRPPGRVPTCLYIAVLFCPCVNTVDDTERKSDKLWKRNQHILTIKLNPWSLNLDSVRYWTHWATLRRHTCLSRAATSASSQVNPIFRRSLLTTPLQFAVDRPGPLLYPGTCQYSACCCMRWWSIRKTCPIQRSYLSHLSILSMVCWHCCPAK